jgi:peptidoglycan hydrolase-like protein with peptidoglycan-binding domain
MGKGLAALLIAVAALIPLRCAVAHEQTRRVQEELRNRHLFYGNPNGEYSAELRAAIKRYQQRKGLSVTGLIDSDTLASLGISGPTPPAEGPIPHEDPPPRLAIVSPPALPIDVRFFEQQQIKLSLPAFHGDELRLGYDLVQLAELSRRNPDAVPPLPIGCELASQPPCCAALGCANASFAIASAEGTGLKLAANSNGRTKSKRNAHARSRRQNNPIILAYHSVNRAVHNLFSDSGRRKKRVVARR